VQEPTGEPDATITIKLWHTPLGTVAKASVDACPSLGQAAPIALSHLANQFGHLAGQIVGAATLDNAEQFDRIRRAPILGTVPLPPVERVPGIGVA
jgi:hypothetical protein